LAAFYEALAQHCRHNQHRTRDHAVERGTHQVGAGRQARQAGIDSLKVATAMLPMVVG
jgi:hypothetical protein